MQSRGDFRGHVDVPPKCRWDPHVNTHSNKYHVIILQIGDAGSLLHEDFNHNVFEPDSFIFKPVVDSYSSTPFLAADPLEMMRRGHFHKVPMIIGNNKDEGLVFSELLSVKMSHLLPLLETDQWEKLLSYWLLKRKELERGNFP